jgi:hypothetical protein
MKASEQMAASSKACRFMETFLVFFVDCQLTCVGAIKYLPCPAICPLILNWGIEITNNSGRNYFTKNRRMKSSQLLFDFTLIYEIIINYLLE